MRGIFLSADEPSPCPSLKGRGILLACFALLAMASHAFGEDAKSPAERGPVVLTDAARKLHAASLVIDGHNDMPWEVRKQGSSSFDKMDISKPQPKLQTDIPRLRAGGVGAQFWSVWVPSKLQGDHAVSATLEQIDAVRALVARYPDDLALARTADEVERAVAAGRIASLLGAEGG